MTAVAEHLFRDELSERQLTSRAVTRPKNRDGLLWVGNGISTVFEADIRCSLDAGRHHKAMNDRFADLISTAGLRAKSAVLQKPVVDETVFLMGERLELAVSVNSPRLLKAALGR